MSDELAGNPWEWSDGQWRGVVDRVRAGRSLKPDHWPNGERVAVALSFDSDHETIPLVRGQHSAGVSRQYCGRLGKVENCQVGVYLAYVAPTGAAFLDTRLYLPKSWTDDRARCRAAKIPDEVAFQTKPALAQAMLEQVWSEAIPLQWVTGDTLYGNSPSLRHAIHTQGRSYVMEIGSHHRVTLPV